MISYADKRSYFLVLYKYKPRSSRMSPDEETEPESSQITQPGPVYETVMECNTSIDLELEITDNVAYAV